MSQARQRAALGALFLGMLSMGCTPNVVLGMRDRDASVPAAMSGAAGSPDPGQNDMEMEMEGTGQMGQCTSSTDCVGRAERMCNVGKGECVECLRDSDCASTERCGADGECATRPVPCTSTPQCAGSDKPFCHPLLLECAECAADADCRSSGRCQPDGQCE